MMLFNMKMNSRKLIFRLVLMIGKKRLEREMGTVMGRGRILRLRVIEGKNIGQEEKVNRILKNLWILF